MNAQDILDVIDKYNLCVRKIPNEVKHVRRVATISSPKGYDEVTYTTPKIKGYMCKAVNDTGSAVIWSKKDNLSDTLEGSIQMFLNSINTDKE